MTKTTPFPGPVHNNLRRELSQRRRLRRSLQSLRDVRRHDIRQRYGRLHGISILLRHIFGRITHWFGYLLYSYDVFIHF